MPEERPKPARDLNQWTWQTKRAASFRQRLEWEIPVIKRRDGIAAGEAGHQVQWGGPQAADRAGLAPLIDLPAARAIADLFMTSSSNVSAEWARRRSAVHPSDRLG